MSTHETTLDLPPEVVAAIRGARRVMVLTGAGMSAESGVPTFRDAQTGLWEEFDPSQLATAEAWQEDPRFVWGWYAWRMHLVRGVEPNAGHRALAELARLREVMISTQNVDDLHERAGSSVAAHVHGSLFALRCTDCDSPYEGEVDLPAEPEERLVPPQCPECGAHVRPGVVWFGEMLPEADVEATEAAIDTLQPGDVTLVIGTSGLVFPAAGYPAMARAEGATVIEINPTETEVSDMCHHVVRGTAAEVLPALVAAVGE
ncbi:SIR2 family NAD-dependent protein deacylase [Janibacter cremeus]|uniref:NAD-dependent protein deacylase n=1 Tax=Janibacter cremeus TaxID=1285192 RepID=A0A852VN97_9MICO|nr:NAD-dependent deacylase [Janibacter cremeus]NYF97148.1 NAD-dependent deacetylase [Janibacter cremeus]